MSEEQKQRLLDAVGVGCGGWITRSEIAHEIGVKQLSNVARQLLYFLVKEGKIEASTFPRRGGISYLYVYRLVKHPDQDATAVDPDVQQDPS
jgi:hypothetical protein